MTGESRDSPCCRRSIGEFATPVNRQPSTAMDVEEGVTPEWKQRKKKLSGLKVSAVLCVAYWLYLIVGGAVFYALESTRGDQSDAEPSPFNCSELQTALLDVSDLTDLSDFSVPVAALRRAVDRWCASSTLAAVAAASPASPASASASGRHAGGAGPSDFSSALFLAMTVATSIGYGRLVPETAAGKMFCVAYGVLGIALGGVMLNVTSGYLSDKLLGLYKQRRARIDHLHHHDQTRWPRKGEGVSKARAVGVATLVFLAPGLLLFVLAPAAAFSAVEDWTYADSLYFSFISLTTIGFGDIVPGKGASADWLWLYRVLIISWVIGGLVYFTMIISFVRKALHSKGLRLVKTTRSISRTLTELLQSSKSVKVTRLTASRVLDAPPADDPDGGGAPADGADGGPPADGAIQYELEFESCDADD